MHGVGAADRLLARLGEAEEAHLPFAHELGHRADDILDRYGGVHAVLVQEVDVVRVEPAERALDSLADVRGPAVHPRNGAVLDLEAELGCDDEPFALPRELLESARQQLLVREGPVDLGRIEERHAELDRPVDGGDRLALVALLRRAVGLAHPHQAEAEGGDGEALRAECACGQHVCLDHQRLREDLSSYCS